MTAVPLIISQKIDLKRVVLDYLHRLYLAVKSDRNAVISKLGLDTITEIEDQIRTAENRADEISHLLIEIYGKKVSKHHYGFRIQEPIRSVKS